MLNVAFDLKKKSDKVVYPFFNYQGIQRVIESELILSINNYDPIFQLDYRKTIDLFGVKNISSDLKPFFSFVFFVFRKEVKSMERVVRPIKIWKLCVVFAV